MNSLVNTKVWKYNAKQWSSVRPPLRPSPEDTGFIAREIADWSKISGNEKPMVLVMGMTPELRTLEFDRGSRVIAIDKTMEMIRALGSCGLKAQEEIICGDWRHTPLPASSVDLILGDGCLNLLPYPFGYAALCKEFVRLLKPQGEWIIRSFVQREPRETVEDICAELLDGKITNFHAFKWRLVMSGQPDPETGVPPSHVWRLFQELWKDYKSFAKRFNFPPNEVETTEAYREAHSRYSFLTLSQHYRFFERHGFSVTKVMTPGYELADRCPTIVLKPIPSNEDRP